MLTTEVEYIASVIRDIKGCAAGDKGSDENNLWSAVTVNFKSVYKWFQ